MRACDDGYPSCRAAEAGKGWCKDDCLALKKAGTSSLTGRAITTVKSLGRGSDYFGACEICHKPVSETFKRTVGQEVQRSDGSIFLIKDRGMYGHASCVSA